MRSSRSVRRRYGWLASVYDWANLEGVLYADARARAIDLLGLRPGARVLDLACGTGANFALIEERIGPTGELVGIDLTPQMLDRARARIAGEPWRNVRLHEARVCDLDVAEVGGPFDAALCTLGLTVIPDWQRAWEAMKAALRTGGRLAIMDAGYPEDRAATMPALPLAWALSRLFAADCTRCPWQLLQRDAPDARTEHFTLGWVTAAAGTPAPT